MVRKKEPYTVVTTSFKDMMKKLGLEETPKEKRENAAARKRDAHIKRREVD